MWACCSAMCIRSALSWLVSRVNIGVVIWPCSIPRLLLFTILVLFCKRKLDFREHLVNFSILIIPSEILSDNIYVVSLTHAVISKFDSLLK